MIRLNIRNLTRDVMLAIMLVGTLGAGIDKGNPINNPMKLAQADSVNGPAGITVADQADPINRPALTVSQAAPIDWADPINGPAPVAQADPIDGPASIVADQADPINRHSPTVAWADPIDGDGHQSVTVAQADPITSPGVKWNT